MAATDDLTFKMPDVPVIPDGWYDATVTECTCDTDTNGWATVKFVFGVPLDDRVDTITARFCVPDWNAKWLKFASTLQRDSGIRTWRALKWACECLRILCALTYISTRSVGHECALCIATQMGLPNIVEWGKKGCRVSVRKPSRAGAKRRGNW